MSQKIPAKLLKFDDLAQVPLSQVPELATHRDQRTGGEPAARRFLNRLMNMKVESSSIPRKRGVTEVTFNAACWMRVFSQINSVVSFFIVYEDEDGEFAVLVDEAKIHEGVPSVMLTNPVTIRFKGQVQSIRACVSGLSRNHYLVDELFVQRVPDQSAGMKRTA